MASRDINDSMACSNFGVFLATAFIPSKGTAAESQYGDIIQGRPRAIYERRPRCKSCERFASQGRYCLLPCGSEFMERRGAANSEKEVALGGDILDRRTITRKIETLGKLAIKADQFGPIHP